ncbi:MAG TPA: endonuclease [Bacteroidales bacterium]|nr:MAG: hypothetical protein A2W98_07995 [Bacteroidetes bacterium GWF2_33_38]OFY88362.1 MAG: hypothetical protein A2236_02235 [Bacteroidetes bacterium RIFOXYA2_FULL_33_7]HBF87342.1 endonuclease [Bacteroidales bacterium]
MTSFSKYIIVVSLFVIATISCKQQDNSVKSTPVEEDPSYADSRGYFRVMFYNAENLFDTYDDSLKQDNEFLPEGEKHWSWSKYNKKLLNICKVITAVGSWDPPEIVGLCEIENRYVLEGIVQHTPLNKHNYQVIHYESPDNRGIDVGMLYVKNKFYPISTKAIRIIFPFAESKTTRDILYVKGVTYKHDTLHVFVNHWPSRWGGQLESEQNRVYVANVLKNTVDSIFKTDKRANIIIVGDLNDGVEDKSVKDVLEANITYDNIKANKLYNFSYYLQKNKGLGSHKYNGEWGVLDHLIVSGSLIDQENDLYTTKDNAHIFNATFLLEKDEAHFGYKPFRTYIGYKFNDGYSDHLPVFIDLYKTKK